MVIRGDDAGRLNLHRISDIAPFAPKWRVGAGYEFQERPDGFKGWSERYNLQFAAPPSAMDLGLIYRALVDKKVDIVAGNSTDGLIEALRLVALEDDLHYFPPYDAVPIVRQFHSRKISAAPLYPRRPGRKNHRRRHAPPQLPSRRRPTRRSHSRPRFPPGQRSLILPGISLPR